MKFYVNRDNRLVEAEELTEQTVWIDLLSPTSDEKKRIETFLDIQIPTKEEMQEIESSSRLYNENDALFMTVNILKKDNGSYKLINGTFILKGNTLVTLRYDDAGPIALFLKIATNKPTFPVNNAVSLTLAILEAIIEKSADALEVISGAIENLSQMTFAEKKKGDASLSQILIHMGQQGEINSKTRESLSSITRMIGYLKFHVPRQEESRFETINLDTNDLKDHSTFLGQKISFMLNANLGLIQIEQNNIIKIFSVAAVVLMPPTLIASIYGMNFHFMPELSWPVGYPLAILLMIISATLPYMYFKKKGWL